MDSSLKRRDQMPQPPPPSSSPLSLTSTLNSDEENLPQEDRDSLVSPCKRLRLADSPARPATTLADHSNVQNSVSLSDISDQHVLYNTPEKPRHDVATYTTSQEDLVSHCNSTLEKSQAPAEDPSVLSSLEQAEPSGGGDSPGRNMYFQAAPPRDEVLLSTPVKTLTYQLDHDESALFCTPSQTMPNNTPERSVLLDDSDGEDIFINASTVSEQQSCAVNPPPSPSVTFADRTNLDGLRHQAGSVQDTAEFSSEESVTFADQTNVRGVQPKVDLPERAANNEAKTVQGIPRPRFSSHQDPCINTEPFRNLPPRGLPAQQQQQQRPRFSSVGNLLCPEELDHHRLSLQSYGSVSHFERQQQQGLGPPQRFPVVRAGSHRNVFQPQNLQPRLSQVQVSADDSSGRLIDYGSIDGHVGRGVGHAVGPRDFMNCGNVDDPVAAARGGGGSMPNRPPSHGGAEAQVPGRLWYYGSVDDPQRLTSSVQSLLHQPGGGQVGHMLPSKYGEFGGNLLSQRHEEAFVRSATRRTLPRLGSQGSDRNQAILGASHNHQHHTGQGMSEDARPHLGQIREVPETGDAKPGGTKSSRGTLCSLADRGQHSDSAPPHGAYPPGYVVHPSGQNQPQHSQPAGSNARLSGSSGGSHADALSRGSSGKPDGLRHSDPSGDHPQYLSGSQGSLKSQGRSVGSQRSWGSQHSGGSQEPSGGEGGRGGHRVNEGLLPPRERFLGDQAPVEGSKKRRVLETPGQVRVSAYLNCGLVTVHVIEGRGFTCTWKATCDSYIKLSLIPEDSGKKLRLKSKPVHNTNNPFFDEKFSLELQSSDENKRLLVSFWHKDLQSGCSEFLGCMSFGVKGILRHKDVNGWYYLLTEDVGKKKHLQVSAHTSHKAALVRPRSNNARTIPQINRDVYGLQSFTIHVERGKNGFGFTVVDEFPVRVGRVDLASPAEESGLKAGDFIIKVNNQNVSRSTVNSVAKLVKRSGPSLVLDINRCQSTPTTTAAASPPPPPQETSEGALYGKYDSCLWKRSDHIYESIAEGTLADDDDDDSDDDDKENDEEAVGGYQSMNTEFEISSVCEVFTQDKVWSSTPMVASAVKRMMRGGGGGQSVAEQKKGEAIHRLLSLELDFIDFMQHGVQRYARPLRHRIFTTQQHSAVFQNIEKLVNISEFHVQQIQENAPSLYPESDDDSQSSDDRHFASAVAMIYYSKAHMFCQAHEAYAGGLSEANRVLSEMRQNQEFLRFIKDPPLEPGQPSISAFIFRPLQHIKELSSVFQDIFMHTPSSSIDHATLKQVTRVLQDSVRTISHMSNARVQSVTSLSSHTKSSCSSSTASSAASSRMDSGSESGHLPLMPRGGGSGGVSGLRPSGSVQMVFPVDREVIHMQDRLIFSHNVPVFQLCQEDRHVIYQGDVFFLHNNHWSKIVMTLLSDVVVLCRGDKDGSLHVLCDPVYVHHICHIDANRKHCTELMLSICPTSPCSGLPSTQQLVLRAPTPEDLSTWKNLLEQRVKRVHQDNHPTPPEALPAPPPHTNCPGGPQ